MHPGAYLAMCNRSASLLSADKQARNLAGKAQTRLSDQTGTASRLYARAAPFLGPAVSLTR
jgi:hypothetical protein